MKTCLALFLKNENPNILSWISWHLAIGIDKFFIYDDHSTDGTYEILKTVSNIYNIEIEQTDLQNTPIFYCRQADSFKNACKKAKKQNFDWIGFIDVDEYISLERDSSIQDFLSAFSEYNGISLNWRIYGNSDRVLKTKLPTYEAYLWHSQQNFGDNKLTKSFIRPEYFTNTYLNPHFFLIEPRNYANSEGNPVIIENGASKNVTWKNACINHYINRSMEDYVDRTKNRLNTDIKDSLSRWNYFNRNDIYHQERKEIVQKANKILSNIKKECVYHYIYNLTGYLPYDLETNNQIRIFSFQSILNKPLGLEKHENFLCHFLNNQKIKKIYGAIYPENTKLLYLFNYENHTISNIPFNIYGINKFYSTYQVNINKIENSDYFTLQSPDTKKFFCFPQSEKSNNCIVEANRDYYLEWEFIKLQTEKIRISFNCSPHSVKDLYSFYHYLRINKYNISYEDFILAYNILNLEEQLKLHEQNFGKIISWL